MNKKKVIRIICIALLPVSVLIDRLSHDHTVFTEEVYSRHIYRTMSLLISSFFGMIPFSVAEMISLICLLAILIFIIMRVIKKNNKKKHKKPKPKVLGRISVILAAAGIIYFTFIIIWGLNYNRADSYKLFGLEKNDINSTILYDTGEDIAKRLNLLCSKVDYEDFDLERLISEGNAGYYRLQDRYPFLGGNYTDIKPLSASAVWAYLQIWGVYSPYTFEANINTMTPPVLLPVTIAHELAHLRGFAREYEAGFIAYLTCLNHSDICYVYSGSLYAFVKIANMLEQFDIEKSSELMNKLDDTVIGHINDANDLLEKYEGLPGRISGIVNDLFLRANRQEEGIKSYDRTVDLIIAYHLNDTGEAR